MTSLLRSARWRAYLRDCGALAQSAEPNALLDPQTANLHAVTNVDYNAKGLRTLIEYGNGADSTGKLASGGLANSGLVRLRRLGARFWR